MARGTKIGTNQNEAMNATRRIVATISGKDDIGPFDYRIAVRRRLQRREAPSPKIIWSLLCNGCSELPHQIKFLSDYALFRLHIFSHCALVTSCPLHIMSSSHYALFTLYFFTLYNPRSLNLNTSPSHRRFCSICSRIWASRLITSSIRASIKDCGRTTHFSPIRQPIHLACGASIRKETQSLKIWPNHKLLTLVFFIEEAHHHHCSNSRDLDAVESAEAHRLLAQTNQCRLWRFESRPTFPFITT